MDLLTALASLAAAHPSTPIDLGIEREEDSWYATLTIFLSDEEQPILAEGVGATSIDAMNDLYIQILRL